MIDPTRAAAANAEVRALVQQRRKIEAIKLVRERTGIGLKEAKDCVEALEREMGLPVGTPGSVVGLLVFVVIILGLVGWWWLRA